MIKKETTMDILDKEMLQLWKSLHAAGVQYIMVGGFATNLHGFSRTTADLDIWIKDNKDNRKKLGQVLKELNLGDYKNIETMDFLAGWSAISMSSGFELDIMTRLKSFGPENFEECYDTAPIAVIYDIPIRFLHINHLIQEKKICGRPKDMLDIIELKKIKGK
jgi:hypothetical protein